ncbi:MAG: hypothetical protein IH942_07135 [Acidobacteria bacterium]|nr:hypothetical protein [Acidobacteriota bacterium]
MWLENAWNSVLDFDLAQRLAERRSTAAADKTAKERAAFEKSMEELAVTVASSGETTEAQPVEEQAVAKTRAEKRAALEHRATDRATQAEKSLLARIGGWLQPRKLIIALLTVGGIVGLILVLLVTGNLGAFYEWLIGWSSDGKPWTHIMDEQPWIFWVGAIVILVSVFWLVPRRAHGRVWIITSGFAVGFLGGHVFW